MTHLSVQVLFPLVHGQVLQNSESHLFCLCLDRQILFLLPLLACRISNSILNNCPHKVVKYQSLLGLQLYL